MSADCQFAFIINSTKGFIVQVVNDIAAWNLRRRKILCNEDDAN